MKNSSTKSTQWTPNLEWYPQAYLGTLKEVKILLQELEADRWRLPTILELVSQFDYADRLRERKDWTKEMYWTNQPFRAYPDHQFYWERDSCFHYAVGFLNGEVKYEHVNARCAARFCREVMP